MTDIPLAQQRDVLTPAMLEALRQTKPWVRFLSILGFLMVAFICLVGVGMGGFGLWRVTQAGNDGWFFVGLAFLYLLMALLYVFPSRFLFQYASAIQEALRAPSKAASVERALGYQKSFWKFAGIVVLVTLLLYIPVVVAAIALPNFFAAMQR